ncbi:alpha/beta hydrolase [soil metagenome]
MSLSRPSLLASLGAAFVAACSPLTAFNTLAPRDPAQRLARDVAYGPLERQSLDVYAPKARASTGAKPAPVLVFFYGGGWDSGRRQDYAFVGQALAAQGFVTVVPDYRLYPQVRYPDFLTDGALAIRWARDHAAQYGGDPNRILLAGHSAGAYNAVMLGLDADLLRKAGVDPAAIKAVAGLAGPYNFLPLDVKSTIDTFGQYPDLPATQPYSYVRADAPPMFLAWGDADTVVGRQNIERLAPALRDAGASVEVRLYPKVDHAGLVLALSRPFRGKGAVLQDMTAFLKAHAG